MKMQAGNYKGIMFDMDNSLLQSRIDFQAMKRDIFCHLVKIGLLPDAFPWQEHTSSTMIEYAKQLGLTEEQYDSVMKVAAEHELAGMRGAGLEPGVREMLNSLHGQYLLAVITNNALTAALSALERTRIKPYFDCIAGREQMSAMKPSPSGFNYVKLQFPGISDEEWLSVGDSWIDGKASMDANIAFIGYRASVEQMRSKGVRPIGHIQHMNELLKLLER